MKTQKTIAVAAFMALALAAGPAAAADKPDFSGKWVLDVAKSDFGMLPGPDSQTNNIDHKEPKIKVAMTVKTAQGERSSERNLTTDGEENTNTAGPLTSKSRSKWDGNRLVTDAKLQTPNGDVELKETWELGEGGLLLVTRDFKSAMGETTQKLQFKKE